MKYSIIATLVLLSGPAFALTVEERTAEDQKWVDTMALIDICTTDKPAPFSEAERLRGCLIIEQRLRTVGRCMYSPGVLGTWNGKHCN